MTKISKNLSNEMTADQIGGGAKPQTVVDSAVQQACGLPIGGPTDAHLFGSQVLEYMRRWCGRRVDADPRLNGITAFIFSEDPLNDSEALTSTRRILVFQSDADRELGGFLHVSGTGVNALYQGRLQSTTISDAAEELANLQWGNRPAVLVDLAECSAWVFYAGAAPGSGRDEGVPVDLKEPPATVTRASVEAFLHRVYDKTLITPCRIFTVWQDPSKCIPIPETEKAIQGLLMMLASFHLEGCHVVEEPNLSDSRADIVIYPTNHGERTVLELKVLRARAFSSAKKPRRYSISQHRKALVKGIDQARDYRERMFIENAFVCAYDMREEDDSGLVEELEATATGLDVVLRRYYLYRDAEHRRQSLPGSAYQAHVQPTKGRRKSRSR
jgi:hypothetical protein